MRSDSKDIRRPAFTLIETVISLSVMAVLFLGLSGAVVIGSKAIPTTTDTGVKDQEIIDCLNRFRDELRQATTIHYTANASGVIFDLTLKDSGATGAPTSVRYQYHATNDTIARKMDSNVEMVYLTDITDVQTSMLMEDKKIRAIVLRWVAKESLQGNFEAHITLPNKPEAL
jgi:prepilin-type N-terminal cleavage/methylation domain-containing protein